MNSNDSASDRRNNFYIFFALFTFMTGYVVSIENIEFRKVPLASLGRFANNPQDAQKNETSEFNGAQLMLNPRLKDLSQTSN